MRCKRCNKDFVSPFCPNCGARLTVNPFMGESVQELQTAIEDVQYDLRRADARVRKILERHKKELVDPRQAVEKYQNTMRYVSEAMSWARLNNIQHPDARQ